MSEVFSIEFSSPAGEEISFEWGDESLEALEPTAPTRAWRLAGELDWDEVDSVRVLSARLGDGRKLAVAAIRPAGAGGHGEEAIAGILIDEANADGLDEVLLSTERGADDAVRRVGLELYLSEGALPLRIAADAIEASSEVEDGVRADRVGLEVRGGGPAGVGVLEILRRA